MNRQREKMFVCKAFLLFLWNPANLGLEGRRGKGRPSATFTPTLGDLRAYPSGGS